MHRINLIARIHHVIRADLMPLRCMIPLCCQQRYVNGALLRCNGARTPGALEQRAVLRREHVLRAART
jgi:hypothetical protein